MTGRIIIPLLFLRQLLFWSFPPSADITLWMRHHHYDYHCYYNSHNLHHIYNFLDHYYFLHYIALRVAHNCKTAWTDTSVLVTSSCFCANYFRLALWWISISFPHLYSFSPFFLSLIYFLRRLIMRLFFLSLPFLSQCTNAISFILNSLERIKFVQYLSNLQLSNIFLFHKNLGNEILVFFSSNIQLFQF